MKVALLTEEEKNELIGQWVQEGWYFNPTQDADDNWIISEQEIFNCMNPDLDWIQDLPLIEYKPKPQPNPFE